MTFLGIGAKRSAASATVILAALIIAAACTSSNASKGPTGTFPSVGTTPAPSGASCDDPKGDLTTDSRIQGTIADPAGIDIVHAESKLNKETLTVSFVTAGPINQAPNPSFIVAAGTGASDLAFELRTAPDGPGPTPAWTLKLVTFKAGNETPRRALAAPVIVKDNTLSFDVPLKDLPPVVALIWQFGSSSGDGDGAIIDDCNNFTPAGPAGSAPQGTTSTTTPPTTLAPIRLGTEQTYPATGSKVTVFAAQFPMASPKPLPQGLEMEAGGAAGAVDVQVCAGTKATEARPSFFQVKTDDNRIYPSWPVPYSAVDPAFPSLAPLTPGANNCVRGWVTFALPVGRSIASVYYSPDSSGRNFLTWNVT